jgi:sugar diacid utilization regulator
MLLAGDVVGRIWVPGQVSTLNELDLRALEEAAVIGALDILRTRTALEIEWRIHGDIMNVLLDGSPSQFESLTNRAMQLGHDLTRPHTMLVCDIQNLLGTESDVPSEAAVQLAKAAILSMRWQPKTGPLMAMRDGHLIVLAQLTEAAIEPEDLLQLGDAVRHVLNRALATRGVRVAVGAVCRKLTELTRSFKVGCGALGIHAIRRDPPCTILCPTLGLLGLLLQIDDTRQLIDFADGRMRLLREHDASRGAGLVETLERYFSNSCNFERTAQALYVHPNTVRLRIRRAETLLGVDLSTREAQIELHTAFMVDQVARATT